MPPERRNLLLVKKATSPVMLASGDRSPSTSQSTSRKMTTSSGCLSMAASNWPGFAIVFVSHERGSFGTSTTS
jgi:hypothetical protein